MRLRNIFLVLASVFCLAVPSFGQENLPKSKRPRVAVMNFPVAKGAYQGWYGWGVDREERMSDVLMDLFITELGEVGTGKIRLVERAQIDEIRKEQSFGASGEVDPRTAVKLGKLLGVKYMITGKITRFASAKSGFSTGWLAGNAVGRLTGNSNLAYAAGNVDIKKSTFTGRLDVRVIDVETGEIVGSASDEAEVKNVGVKIAGTGNEVQYDQRMVNQVFEPVVKKIAPKLVQKIFADVADQ